MALRPGAKGGGDPLDRYQDTFGGEAPRRRVKARVPGRPGSKSEQAKRRKIAIALFVLVAGLAFAMGYNPPTAGIHYFSKASDYKPAKESGCVNSGKGCHGSERSYQEFNDYHPDMRCTVCHRFTGIGCIPCHKPTQHECASCHDGTTPGAPDRTPITAPYPKGHYRETSHTAMGTDMAQEVRTAVDGKAKAKCSDCHSRDLKAAHTDVQVAKDSPYGTSVTCGECHNDTRLPAVKQVASKWKKRGCAECHAKDSIAPMHDAKVATAVAGVGPLNCGSTGTGCHADNDIHAMHADTPKTCTGSTAKGEPGCHDLKVQASKPTAKGCGAEAAACHGAYVNDGYSHKRDAAVHSPKSGGPAADTSYHKTRCGDCHRMDANGTSLSDEHAIATSSKSKVPGNDCRNCHNDPASQLAITDKWPERDTRDLCSTCHGGYDLPSAHSRGINVLHTVWSGSAGCAASGPGCHPSVDLTEVGTPTVAANIHRDCLRCHDWRQASGDLAYDPARKTCGAGRDCHGANRAYDTRSSVHAGAGGRSDGKDAAHHIAGAPQAGAVYIDTTSGVSTPCKACHDMALGPEHARPSSSLAGGGPAPNACAGCHNHDLAVAAVVKTSWAAKGSAKACDACHALIGSPVPHSRVETIHVGTTLDATGNVSPTACVKSGCHTTADVRVLHAKIGCTIEGCHSPKGDIDGTRIKSCGGVDPRASCHVGEPHPTHAADLTGAVKGIRYSMGENVACFGCHFRDLDAEHAKTLSAMQGGAVNSCRVCHADLADPGSGAYATLPAVKAAVANHDRRCVACHDSGDEFDGPDAVASAHKRISASPTPTAGFVWSDPLSDWRGAFDAVTGGGHNGGLSAAQTGASTTKAFPRTSFEISGTTYTWALPPNFGATRWLDTTALGAAPASTPGQISHITVTCDACHSFGGVPAGPHGSTVRANIDPAYSQTEWANPTADTRQFEATGTARVVCIKCHPMQASSNPLVAPGGDEVHRRHIQHVAKRPLPDPRYYGEKCIDCHVRIPHAWKRPRLLVRTVIASDGVAPDTFPYVRLGHDGLVGIRLRSFVAPGELRWSSCGTGGCHSGHTAARHPQPSDVPTATWWP
jgi:hypothetical protein